MRTDPLQSAGARVGARVSLRVEEPDGLTDRVGLVTALDDTGLILEDRRGRLVEVARATVRLARIVPAVARGRNPRHAPPGLLRALAADEQLGAPAGAECWIARLCDLVDHLDDSGVAPLPGRVDTRESAASGGSRGLVNGEWAALSLLEADALEPLAAWAARRDARNVVLTSSLTDPVLERLGLARLEP